MINISSESSCHFSGYQKCPKIGKTDPCSLITLDPPFNFLKREWFVQRIFIGIKYVLQKNYNSCWRWIFTTKQGRHDKNWIKLVFRLFKKLFAQDRFLFITIRFFNFFKKLCTCWPIFYWIHYTQQWSLPTRQVLAFLWYSSSLG